MRLSRSLTPKWWQSYLCSLFSFLHSDRNVFIPKKRGGGDQNQRNLIVDIFLLELLLELKEFPSERGNPSVGNSKKV